MNSQFSDCSLLSFHDSTRFTGVTAIPWFYQKNFESAQIGSDSSAESSLSERHSLSSDPHLHTAAPGSLNGTELEQYLIDVNQLYWRWCWAA